MKPIKILNLLILFIFTSACGTKNSENLSINPLDDFVQVDSLLNSIAESPQKFQAPSNKKSIIKGKNGTIINIEPLNLETIDGTPLGSTIDIELLEMGNKASLLANNTPTTSNGKLLVTGGAYYLNMKSNGKQLKIKKDKSLSVEFPKHTDNEMALFLGERDSIGQVNWLPANEKFNSKNLEIPKAPKRIAKTKYVKKTYSGIESIIGYIEGDTAELKPLKEEEVSEKEYKEYLKKKAEIEIQNKTYEAINLLNFGWINCDRFYQDKSPKVDLELIVENDSIIGARFYGVFKDINSIMTANYSNNNKNKIGLYDIPSGKEVKIIGIAVLNGVPLLFEKEIKPTSDTKIKVQFLETTQEKLRDKLIRIN